MWLAAKVNIRRTPVDFHFQVPLLIILDKPSHTVEVRSNEKGQWAKRKCFLIRRQGSSPPEGIVGGARGANRTRTFQVELLHTAITLDR